jgi:hypothetical protein
VGRWGDVGSNVGGVCETIKELLSEKRRRKSALRLLLSNCQKQQLWTLLFLLILSGDSKFTYFFSQKNGMGNPAKVKE